MATKIRLQRRGRKDYPFYQIVVADSRAPRDGKFIEKVGSYNPNTNPATITLDFDRALYWLQCGAQPTDTARNILSNEGVLLKKHLLGGVKKGAFSAEEADRKFESWLTEKGKATDVLKNKTAAQKAAELKARLDAEKAANKAKAEAVAQKRAENNVQEAEAEVAEDPNAGVEAIEAEEATVVTPEVVEEVAETPETTEEVVEPASEKEAE